MKTQGREITRYLKSTIYVLILMAMIASVAGMAYGMPSGGGKAVITPEANEYSHTTAPKFNIETGSNRYYKIQFALGKPIFAMEDTDSYKISSGERRNFYSTDWLDCGDAVYVMAPMGDVAQCQGGVGTFTLDSAVWRNLRSAVVFYRILTNTSKSESEAMISEARSLGRTGETWYGLPFNDRATIGSLSVVINGQLNNKAFSSDYGPRWDGGTKFHPGIDIPVAVGTPVYSIADGKVVKVPVSNDSHHRLDIEHRNASNQTYYTGYVHLDKWLVGAEDVKAGQLIGYSGDWVGGQHKAAHLHFDAGYQPKQIYNNVLHYLRPPYTSSVRYIDAHIMNADGSNTFITGDAKSHGNAIDVWKSVHDAERAIIGFGITTVDDKDLNYVEVQVDDSHEDKQYFKLDYDSVINQSDGEITLLDNGVSKKFAILRTTTQPETDMYSITDYQYNFYVSADMTNIDETVEDFFYLVWDVSRFAQDDNGGAHRIRVTAREVSGHQITRELTIGPELSRDGEPTIDGNTITYRLSVTNHDYQNGDISLKVKDEPMGWESKISGNTTSIPAGGTVTILLTLENTQGSADLAALCSTNTRVVATFDRISTLKDTAELCPEVWIDQPAAGSEFSEGDLVPVIVKVRSGLTATNVRLSIAGGQPASMVSQGNNAWQYQWLAPSISEYTKQFSLQAIADIQGVEARSADVNVLVKKKSETKYVWINHPAENELLVPGESYPIEVQTSPAASGVILKIFRGHSEGIPEEGNKINEISLSAFNDSRLLWIGNWPVPDKEENYTLIAVAEFSDGNASSEKREIAAVNKEVGPNPIKFLEPQDYGSVYFAQHDKDFRIVTVEAPYAERVTLSISPDNTPIIEMKSIGSGKWQYAQWTPDDEYEDGVETYTLTATSYLPQGDGSNQVIITVYGKRPGNDDGEGPKVSFLNISQDQLITQVFPIRVQATDNEEVTLVGMEVSSCGEKRYLDNPISCGPDCYEFDWDPWKNGYHRFEATALDASGNSGGLTLYADIKVDGLEDCADTIQINNYAFLRHIWGLKYDRYWMPDEKYNTGIRSQDYVCSVVGFSAKGGDIGEENYLPIVRMYLQEENGGGANYKTWHLLADFATRHRDFTGNSSDDRSETWDVTLLCISSAVAAIGGPQSGKDFFLFSPPRLGDNVGSKVFYDTGYQYDQYACGIAGFDSDKGDIDEGAGGDIFHMNLYRHNGTWWVRADFKTHNRHEDWKIHILCMSRNVASIDGPVPDKAYFVQEYINLGDNVGSKRQVNTGFSTDDYACGVLGFAARGGDIDEGNFQETNANLLLAHTYPNNGTWHIRADFRTHNDHENWDVNLFCALKDGRAPVKWNVSHVETEMPNCLGSGTQCQILRYEGISAFAPKYQDYMVLGGGYSEAPLSFESKCGGSAYIEVYEDIRKAGSERLQWSESWARPSKCLQSGEVIRLYNGIKYDFRGVSLHGGQTRPFELRPVNGPPILGKAYPKLYLGEWPVGSGKLLGPGMEVTFSASFHPDASKYEIQISEDGGASWQACSTCGYNLDGFIQHHGTSACGYGFYHCLDRNKTYAYRMRALNAASVPITDWSNVLSATSMEWPAHVQLAMPSPKGPYYASPSTVTLSLVNTYGYKMKLTWQITPWSGAAYTIKSGCQEGDYSCVLEIRDETNSPVSGLSSSPKLSALAPVTSIDVLAIGESLIDGRTYRSEDKVSLFFTDECIGPECNNTSTFKDVPVDHWASPYVEELHNEGYVSGCKPEGDPEFCIEQEMSRAEMAVVLVRALHQEQGYTPPEPSTNPFIDATGIWPDKWMVALYDLGITAGCSRDPLKFCPWDQITWAQMVVYLERVVHGASYQPPDDVEGFFVDVPKLDANGNRNWQFAWVHGALNDGLIQACGVDMEKRLFGPDRIVTRDEMACGLYYAVQTRDVK